MIRGPTMSPCKRFARYLVAIASFAIVSVNATPSRAQSQGENADSSAPLYNKVSIKPANSGIHANRVLNLGPLAATATNEPTQELIKIAYDVRDDQIVGAPSWLNSARYDIEAKADHPAAGDGGE